LAECGVINKYKLTSTVYEAQTSVSVTGLDEQIWTAYGFVDHIMAKESNYHQDQLSTDWPDPLAARQTFTNSLNSDPRPFYFQVLEVRMNKIWREWYTILPKVTNDEIQERASKMIAQRYDIAEKSLLTAWKLLEWVTPHWFKPDEGRGARFDLVSMVASEFVLVYQWHTGSNRFLYGTGKNGDQTVVRLLLENGANANGKNLDGDTPLERAALNGRRSAVQLLQAKAAQHVPESSADLLKTHMLDTSARASVLAGFASSIWFTRGWTLQELIGPSIWSSHLRDGMALGEKTE
jgi:hypothetical protein